MAKGSVAPGFLASLGLMDESFGPLLVTIDAPLSANEAPEPHFPYLNISDPITFFSDTVPLDQFVFRDDVSTWSGQDSSSHVSVVPSIDPERYSLWYSDLWAMAGAPELLPAKDDFFSVLDEAQQIDRYLQRAIDDPEATRLSHLVSDVNWMESSVRAMHDVGRSLITENYSSSILGAEFLRDMVFERRSIAASGKNRKGQPAAPQPIHSVDLVLPMSFWNSAVTKEAATLMKLLVFRLAREFFARDMSVEEFIAALSPDADPTVRLDAEKIASELLASPQDYGRVSFVNKTVVAIQLHETSRLAEFLENLPRLADAALIAMLARTHDLQSQLQENFRIGAVSDFDNVSKISRAQRDLDVFIQHFEQIGEEPVKYIGRNEQGERVVRAVTEFGLERIVAGVSHYPENEDGYQTRNLKRNKSRALMTASRMRDEALTRAEGLAQRVSELDDEEFAQLKVMDRIQTQDHPSDTPRLYWREGRYLSVRRIQSALEALYKKCMTRASGDSSTVQEQGIETPESLQKALYGVAVSRRTKRLHTPNSSQREAAMREALGWMLALSDPAFPARAERLEKLAEACHDCFMSPVESSMVAILYDALGGTIDPKRMVRDFTLKQTHDGRLGILGMLERVKSQLTVPFQAGQVKVPCDRQLADSLRELRGEYRRLTQKYRGFAYDLLNGVARPEGVFASAVYHGVREHYERLEAAGLTDTDVVPGYVFIGFEAMNARVLDREGNPVTDKHIFDANMQLLKRSPFKAVQRFARSLSEKLAGAGLKLPVELYAMGDELVLALPRHTQTGRALNEGDFSVIAMMIREMLWQDVPYMIHYETKIKEGKRVQRPKIYRMKDEQGRVWRVAAAAGAFERKDPDEPVWWLEGEDGTVLEKPLRKSLRDLDGCSAESVRGKVNCRLCVSSIDLKPFDERLGRRLESREEIIAYLDAYKQFTIDLDEALRAYAKSHHLVAEDGIYVYEAGTKSFRQIGTQADIDAMLKQSIIRLHLQQMQQWRAEHGIFPWRISANWLVPVTQWSHYFSSVI